MGHYQYLETNLAAFLKAVGCPEFVVSCAGGLISAHGDKFYGYRDAFEAAGIPFHFGSAIGLLSYVDPFAKECRETPNGFVRVEDWVVANKDRFLPLLPPVSRATNEEIDEAVLSCVGSEGISSFAIAGRLYSKFEGRLGPAGKNSAVPIHNAGEHANRACQRLRKSGKIQFVSKAGWILSKE